MIVFQCFCFSSGITASEKSLFLKPFHENPSYFLFWKNAFATIKISIICDVVPFNNAGNFGARRYWLFPSVIINKSSCFFINRTKFWEIFLFYFWYYFCFISSSSASKIFQAMFFLSSVGNIIPLPPYLWTKSRRLLLLFPGDLTFIMT